MTQTPVTGKWTESEVRCLVKAYIANSPNGVIDRKAALAQYRKSFNRNNGGPQMYISVLTKFDIRNDLKGLNNPSQMFQKVMSEYPEVWTM